MTWSQAVAVAADIFAQRGFPGDAYQRAWSFVVCAFRMSLEDVIPGRAQEDLPRDFEARLIDLFRRLKSGEPEGYVLGSVDFFDCEVRVDGRCLIPRPETESLVETVVKHLEKRMGSPLRILELGTGTGCISKAIIQACPDVHVVATDFSKAALTLAKENLSAEILKDRISLVASDWFTAFGAGHEWDGIISNPPYIPEKELSNLPESVREWEPSVALNGGDRGIQDIRAIIREAPYHLKPGGLLAMEFSPEQAGEIVEIIADEDWAKECIIHMDFARRPRIVLAERKEPLECCAA